jgi:hypothetical protein
VRRRPSAAARPPAQRPAQSLLRALERGESLERAVLVQVRSLVAAGRHDRAQAVAESLRAHDPTTTLGHVAGGIVAFRRGYRELAWEELRTVPREVWATLAPAEYVRSGLSIDPGEVLRDVRDLVAADPDRVRARNWFEILTAVWGYGAAELARDAFAIFDGHVRHGDTGWRDARRQRDWLRPWVAAAPDSPTAPPPEGGRRTFAIMDYGHPSARKASANIGDHIQSIAALGHLVRHRRVRLHGRGELVELLSELGERTRPDRRLDGVETDLEVITVHRDASMYEPIPPDTWALAFGWFMHPLFHMRHGFPPHRNLRPIYVSFHCNKRQLLTPEAIDHLRRHGPVGCRDWTTVWLLLSLDVPAFFSGCLTTTIDTVFEELGERPGPEAPVAYVDIPPEAVPRDGVTYRHSREAVRLRPFVANVRVALDLLETYRTRHRAVVTSRLHCYLPVRSLGVDVEFRPKNRADIRFDGLIDIDDGEFAAIRDGLLDKLEQVLGAILAGRPEEEVYALWREITAADVAAAESRRREPARLAPAPAGVLTRARALAAGGVEHGRGPAGADTVHCAVVLPRGAGLSLSVLVASLLDHCSRPLHLWVLARPGAEGVERRLAARFPELSFTWLPLRGLGRDLETPTGRRPPAAGLIRLLTPELLPDVERVILLGLPAVATGDLAELADLDLDGHALAAPREPGSTTSASGFAVIHAAAARLDARTDAATELRRLAHARHAFDFDALTTDVLVLDLARLRADGFSAEALSLVEGFGLDDLEVLHHIYGPARATVPDRWAFVPTRMPYRGPGLIRWADRVKPWHNALTPERDRWRRYATALRKADAPARA